MSRVSGLGYKAVEITGKTMLQQDRKRKSTSKICSLASNADTVEFTYNHTRNTYHISHEIKQKIDVIGY